jgi:hypothetical protein
MSRNVAVLRHLACGSFSIWVFGCTYIPGLSFGHYIGTFETFKVIDALEQ